MNDNPPTQQDRKSRGIDHVRVSDGSRADAHNQLKEIKYLDEEYSRLTQEKRENDFSLAEVSQAAIMRRQSEIRKQYGREGVGVYAKEKADMIDRRMSLIRRNVDIEARLKQIKKKKSVYLGELQEKHSGDKNRDRDPFVMEKILACLLRIEAHLKVKTNG